MYDKIIAIIANGEIIESLLLEEILADVSIIIAADGGAVNCRILNIKPDYIIGDLDSITPELRRHFSDTKIINRPDQNYTDMQKAIRFALTLSPRRLKILSAFGKRADHTIGNMLIFQDYRESVPIEIYDNYGKMQILNAGKHVIKGETGKTVSILSMAPVTNLTLKGFRYTISNRNFNPSFIGVSNVYESENCQIEFDSGKVFLYEVLKRV